MAPALLALVALALGPAAAPAGAVVVKAEGVSVGLQPRSTELLDGVAAPEDPFTHPEPLEFSNPTGAPVLPATKIYMIYWDPTYHYHGDWEELIDKFTQRMGAESGSLGAVFAVDGQYTDRTNQHASYRSTFQGAYTDTERYPTAGCTDPKPLEGKSVPSAEPNEITCLTDQQIQTQLENFIAKQALPKGMGTVFYVLTPPGVTVCLKGGGPSGHCSDYENISSESYENSFCSYHSDINPDNSSTGDASTILYATIPWTAGTIADGHMGSDALLPGYMCQDGGYNPTSEPPEQKEKEKERTKKQEEEYNEGNGEQKRKILEAEALEGPHQEEPNQAIKPGADGTYDVGLADLIVNQIAVEQQNVVTDPLLNAWQDPAHNEATDECRDFFAPTLGGSVGANKAAGAGTLYNQTLDGGDYYLNTAFDLAALKLAYPGVPCITGVGLEPQFTAPNPVNSEEIVGFNGTESDVTLDWADEYPSTGLPKPTYAVYKWNFGDGTPEVTGYAPGGPPNTPSSLCEEPWRAPCAGSVFHTYQYGGLYNVSLTVTDVAGDTATVTHEVTVAGPTPPPTGGSETVAESSPGAGSPGATLPASTPPASTPPASSLTAPPIPGPVATAAAVSSSIKQVTHSGLVVRYTVNEQVAGHFEVLLSASLAHKLGISGRTATNLPAGFPKSLVIGQALLVTTKGGHSTVRIKFGKRTAKRLRRARKVTLTLRLVVRNASSKSPVFTTVISTVPLHR
jgi:PKD domain-containing protein